MHVIALAWAYVVLLMALAEALSSQGTLLGAFLTVIFYGVLPLSILLYVLNTPHRRRARSAAEAVALHTAADGKGSSLQPPNGGDQPSGDAVAPVGKEA